MRYIGSGIKISSIGPTGETMLEVRDMRDNGICFIICGQVVYVDDEDALKIAKWLQEQVMG